MEPVCLDMGHYKRIEHFRYFRSLAYPYVGLTSEVDITEFRRYVKNNHYPFFLSFLWCASQAANAVEEFRQRIAGEGIVQFSFCETSHTVAKEDGTYCYCTLDAQKPFKEYLAYAASEQEKAGLYGGIQETAAEALPLIFVSTVPWISYTSLVQPVPMPADSNPRITWGKFYDREGRIVMPVSVLCHHALVDGIHIADFYRLIDEKMRQVMDCPDK